jgi:hypothetical protein
MSHPAKGEGAPALLVVGGTMRGGTSLLHHLLDSHPRIDLMTLELRALRYADLATWSHAAAVHQSWVSTFNRIRHREFRGQVLRYLRAILRSQGLNELVSVDRIHLALCAALANDDTHYVGDKWPDYALLYPQLIHRPNTRCVFIYRDARDVVASIVERVQNGDWKSRKWATRYNTVEKATEYWVTIMQALTDVERLESNALLVRYEDLVERALDTIAAIASHLALPAEGFDASLPNGSSIGRYRERLRPGDLNVVERRAGAMMEAWGYSPGEA